MNAWMDTDGVTVFHGDCREVMAQLLDASVDAIVTDPPYELGFMGKGWDASGIAYNPEVWAQSLRVLKPGGHLLAFGGTRTWHRLAVAIEDAGFEVRDSIAWMYGSGFPKSLDVSKAIDKRGGYPHLAAEIGEALKSARVARGLTASEADRMFCGGSTNWTWFEGRPKGQRAPTMETFSIIASAWPELAHLAEKVAEAEREVVGKSEHKSGIANGVEGHHTVGGTRAEHYDITAPATPAAQQWQGWGTALKPAFEPIVVARKPLIGTVAENVLTHGTGALNIDGCRVATDDNLNGGTFGGIFGNGAPTIDKPIGTGRWPANVILDESQAAELDKQSGVSTSVGQAHFKPREIYNADADGYDITGTAIGYGDTGGASRFFYCPKAPKRERPNIDGTAHPTVKPLTLMQYLCRLITGPGGTILDPFAGSGTTIEAAITEGFNIIGIELTDDYLPLIQHRIQRATEDKQGKLL